MLSRDAAWERLSQPLDVLVIGGGITGAGVLLEAARRGLSAVLVEQGDFASGTSSRSSKLVHGGLRYLREGKLRLTRESVREREALLREAAGLVQPMPFLMPHYRGRGPGRALTQAGLLLYDVLAGTRQRGYLNAAQTLELEPAIASADLLGAHAFADATTDDARLVLRVISQAERFGSAAVNYAHAASFEREGGTVRAVIVEDRVTGKLRRVTARAFVNATGAFADVLRAEVEAEPKLRPLRGSHLLLRADRLPLAHAVAFAHPADGRPVFAYPWMDMTLAGTTDVDHRGDLRKEPTITSDELQYLLDALAAQFPQAHVGRGDVVSTFAGVRPVVSSGRARPSSESRDHVLLEERGLITIAGGKLTTFRPMALAALRAAAKQIGRNIDMRPEPIFEAAAPTRSTRLNGRYGPQAADVIAAAQAGEMDFIGGTHTAWAELRYALRAECVVRLDDLLLRRTRLGLQLAQGGAQILPRVRELCEQELGWDDAAWSREAARYREMIRAHYGVPA